MNFQNGGETPLVVRNRAATRPVLAVLCLGILLLGTQNSPAPVSASVAYSANRTSGIATLPVLFSAAAISNTGGHTVTNWVWTFNDGSAGATGQNPAHNYTAI